MCMLKLNKVRAEIAGVLLVGMFLTPRIASAQGPPKRGGSGHKVTAPEALSDADLAALHEALDEYDQGKLELAEPMLRKLATRYPKNYESNEALGSLIAESGDASAALVYLKRAVSTAPKEAIAHAKLGAALLTL